MGGCANLLCTTAQVLVATEFECVHVGIWKGLLMLLLFVVVYFETYGCQMNVNDTEIAWSILKDRGFAKTNDIVQVKNTCRTQHREMYTLLIRQM